MSPRFRFGELPLRQRNVNAMKNRLEPLHSRGTARCASRWEIPYVLSQYGPAIPVELLIPALVSKPSSFAMPFLQGAVAVEL